MWEILDMPYRPGFGRVIVALQNAITAAENGAHKTFAKEKDSK